MLRLPAGTAVKRRDIISETLLQVGEHLLVGGLPLVVGIDKIGTQTNKLVRQAVPPHDHNAVGREFAVVITIGYITDEDYSVQVVERTADGTRSDPGGKHRHRIAAIDPQSRQIRLLKVQREIIARHPLVVQV